MGGTVLDLLAWIDSRSLRIARSTVHGAVPTAGHCSTVPLVQQVSGVEKIVIADRDMTYYLFWDINSLIGVLLMLYFFWMLPAEKRARPNKNIYRYWLCLLAFIPVFFALLFPDIKVSLANVTITAINSVLLSLVVTSVVFSFPARSGKQALIRAGKKEGQRNRYPSVFNK